MYWFSSVQYYLWSLCPCPALLGLEPRTLHMLGKCSTTALYPRELCSFCGWLVSHHGHNLVFFVRSPTSEGGYHEESCRTGECNISLTKWISFLGCVCSVGLLDHEWGSYLSSLRNVHTFADNERTHSHLFQRLWVSPQSALFFWW